MHDMRVQMQAPQAVPPAIVERKRFQNPTTDSITSSPEHAEPLPICPSQTPEAAHRPATTEMKGHTAPLCQACLRLLRRVNDAISHPGAQGLDPSPRRKADHLRSLCYAQSSFSEMASAAAAGWRVCGLALAQVRAGRFTPLTWADDDDPWPGDDLTGQEVQRRMGGEGVLLCRPFEEPGGLVCVRFYVDFRDESRVLFATLDEVLWLSMPVRAPVGAAVEPVSAHDESVRSTKNFRQIREWLAHCNRYHPECWSKPARDGSSFLPSRLVDVGGTDESCLRLVTGTDRLPGEQYTTLSYCWGGAQRLKLVSSNVADLEGGFAISELPKTIREAVEVTREMGVRYLWVDSICIMQDSVDDWESEAVRMSDVYGSSYCTIMATDARDSDGGLFRSRADSVVRPTWYEVWHEDQTQPTVFMKEVALEAEGEMSFYTRRLDDAPAAKRAWIFQEHVLSRRLIHFTHDQLMWECQSTVTCESFPEGFNGNGVVNDNYLWIPKLKPTGHMTATLKSISAMLRWANYVEAYSHRELSVPGDRLVAIGGIARRLADIHGLDHSDYAAGLWKHDMPSSLLWISLRAFSTDTSRPRHSLAPSWSWAAIEGSVRYFRSPVHEPARKSLVEVLGVHIEYRDRQVFGQAMSGTVTLSGRLIPIFKSTWKNRGGPEYRSDKIKDPTYAMLWAGRPTRELTFGANQGPIVIFWDVYGAAEEALCVRARLRGTYGLPVFYNAEARSLCGLLLLATDRQGEYRRLGLFQEWQDPPDPGLLHEGEGEGESREWLREFYEAGRFGGQIKPEDLHLYKDDRSLVLI